MFLNNFIAFNAECWGLSCGYLKHILIGEIYSSVIKVPLEDGAADWTLLIIIFNIIMIVIMQSSYGYWGINDQSFVSK